MRGRTRQERHVATSGGTYADGMQSKEILVAFGTEEEPAALGSVWRITARKTDFYLDPIGQAGAIHLSMHGPSGVLSKYLYVVV